MLTCPLGSSVLIPEISRASPLSKSAAPTMLPVRNLLPGQPRRIARSTVYSKSLAATGRPSEYTSPLRSENR
jgi:hypothetical protein